MDRAHSAQRLRGCDETDAKLESSGAERKRKTGRRTFKAGTREAWRNLAEEEALVTNRVRWRCFV